MGSVDIITTALFASPLCLTSMFCDASYVKLSDAIDASALSLLSHPTPWNP